MTDIGLPEGSYELKIGSSFVKPSKGRGDYHTLKYDFKPKSVSADPETYIAFGSNDDVEIAFANEEADKVTLYRGSGKPNKDGKDCLLIFDEETGEMRLEKFISNINVKQTRGADPELEAKWKREIGKMRTTRKPSSHHRSSEKSEKPKEKEKATDKHRIAEKEKSTNPPKSRQPSGGSTKSTQSVRNEPTPKPKEPKPPKEADRPKKSPAERRPSAVGLSDDSATTAKVAEKPNPKIKLGGHTLDLDSGASSSSASSSSSDSDSSSDSETETKKPKARASDEEEGQLMSSDDEHRRSPTAKHHSHRHHRNESKSMGGNQEKLKRKEVKKETDWSSPSSDDECAAALERELNSPAPPTSSSKSTSSQQMIPIKTECPADDDMDMPDLGNSPSFRPPRPSSTMSIRSNSSTTSARGLGPMRGISSHKQLTPSPPLASSRHPSGSMATPTALLIEKQKAKLTPSPPLKPTGAPHLPKTATPSPPVILPGNRASAPAAPPPPPSSRSSLGADKQKILADDLELSESSGNESD